MAILPTNLGTRPRLACELRPEGVVSARSVDGNLGVMAALARVTLPLGAFRPALRAGSIVDRPAVAGAIRQALEKVFDRTRDITLVVPDASVRVLLLDFDALPAKPAEALPVVRFRLKKLLPFDSDAEASVVTYQAMQTTRGLVRVLAVAIPRDVLAEYESIVREAGFEPGAILPSTLAVLAGLDDSEAPALLVNASPDTVTTAIVRGPILLLHRSLDMRAETHLDPRPEPPPPTIPTELLADNRPQYQLPDIHLEPAVTQIAVLEPVPDIPDTLPPAEIVQAISVAAAYFEDTLEIPPPAILSAGVTSAATLQTMLRHTTLAEIHIRETVDASMLPEGQGPATMLGATPRGWLAGIRGALKS
jgi:type IV pilus assembly protein PilM